MKGKNKLLITFTRNLELLINNDGKNVLASNIYPMLLFLFEIIKIGFKKWLYMFFLPSLSTKKISKTFTSLFEIEWFNRFWICQFIRLNKINKFFFRIYFICPIWHSNKEPF